MAGGIKGKQISRCFEYFRARCGWILFLHMHQTVLATDTTGVNDMMPTEGGTGAGGSRGLSSQG